MKASEFIKEEKVRLDPKCWKGKKIGTPKTKMKGGVRVNNCVPAESVAEAGFPGAPDVEMPPIKHGDPKKDKLTKEYNDLHSELKSLVDRAHAGDVQAKRRIDQIDARIAVIKKALAGLGIATESVNEELEEEFDLIESIVETIAERNQVDAELVWEDLESLTDDELYVFATTTTPIMETEAWQKANNRDRTDGMSRKAVKAYRREHPGSKLKTAVTTKPSKLKKGSKASKRRKSYCSRSKGQMNMHNISCAKTPDKAICKARRRWNC
jgi:hypothetical protein